MITDVWEFSCFKNINIDRCFLFCFVLMEERSSHNRHIMWHQCDINVTTMFTGLKSMIKQTERALFQQFLLLFRNTFLYHRISQSHDFQSIFLVIFHFDYFIFSKFFKNILIFLIFWFANVLNIHFTYVNIHYTIKI